MLNLAELGNKIFNRKPRPLNSLQVDSLYERINRGKLSESLLGTTLWNDYLVPYFDSRPKDLAEYAIQPEQFESREKIEITREIQLGQLMEIKALKDTLSFWIRDGKEALSILERNRKIQEDSKQ